MVEQLGIPRPQTRAEQSLYVDSERVDEHQASDLGCVGLREQPNDEPTE
jgi:hypothetical protein